jgi:dTDP-4-amino-4,6-dideoxygalactose transaminase
MNLSPERLEEFLSRGDSAGVRAVVPVHLYGHPAEMDPLLGLARERGLHPPA